jgi:hypothetical protein
MAQLGDRAARPLCSRLRTPWRPDFEDRHYRSPDRVFDPCLVTGVLGDVLLAPAGDLPQMSLGDRHQEILARCDPAAVTELMPVPCVASGPVRVRSLRMSARWLFQRRTAQETHG